MILISLISLFAIVSSQLQNQSVCKKLESVCDSIFPGGIGIQKVLDEQSRKYSEISNLLAEANEKIRNLENKTDLCAVRYNGKCVWIVYGDLVMTIEEARAICSAEGGKLANIYSEAHHYMLLRYLRMFGNIHGEAYGWVGMTYDSKTNTVSLSDGTPASFVKWYSGFPRSSYSSNIYLAVHRDPETEEQHLVNPRSSWTAYGVICEK